MLIQWLWYNSKFIQIYSKYERIRLTKIDLSAIWGFLKNHKLQAKSQIKRIT